MCVRVVYVCACGVGVCVWCRCVRGVGLFESVRVYRVYVCVGCEGVSVCVCRM